MPKFDHSRIRPYPLDLAVLCPIVLALPNVLRLPVMARVFLLVFPALFLAIVFVQPFWLPELKSATAAAPSVFIPRYFDFSPFLPFTVYSLMPASSSNSSGDSCHSFFDHPRPAPPPPSVASHSTRSTPEGFVLPLIPPAVDPLVVNYDSRGHRQLPRVSDSPLPVDDTRVLRLIEQLPQVSPKCTNCAEMSVECSFTEAGQPCPSCFILGVPDCEWACPFSFMETMRRCRDSHLLAERDALVKAVKDNHLPPSLFEREFERSESWFYQGVQGAIARFLVNSRATRDVAVRGYQALAAAAPDPSILLWFLTLGVEARIHPSVLQVVTERVQAFFAAMTS
ncbi:hypothetical protein C8R43DRAFT_1130475 [Mycena crocata]|nr:hypothetical protein C8R43DRAFT_1130475 [Mycena crocata]